MTARILSGKEFAAAIKSEVAAGSGEFRLLHGRPPGLAVVRVGDDPASSVYVRNKVQSADEVGIHSEHLHLDESVSAAELLSTVDKLNSRDDIDGILVQLPLPKHLSETVILERIDPAKDVDGFSPINAGRLMQGQTTLSPCTPAGVIEMMKRAEIAISGKHAVIVGRSNIVGKPMAMLLLNENATVTICHSKTVGLAEITRKADILVAAIGRPGFIRGEHISSGAVVIDVGINRLTDKEIAGDLFSEQDLPRRIEAIESRGSTLVGDVNPKEAAAKAGFFTPVPGGVGLLTVAMLMKNTLTAALARKTGH